MKYWVIALCVSLLLLVNIQAQDTLQVVATTSIIADVAQNVGGDLVEVESVIPIGNDVHGYSPTPQDVARIVEADVVLVNGLDLEESLLSIIEENSDPVIVSVGTLAISIDGDILGEIDEHGECIAEADEHDEEGHEHEDDHDEEDHDDHDDHDDHEHGACDPHVWLNPANVMVWAQNMAAAFADADPDNAAVYQANAEAYIEELMTLNDAIMAMIDTIPVENRILVTNHAFLRHYAYAYDLDFVGAIIPGMSTLAESNPISLANLIAIINANNVQAIFAEEAVNSDMADVVAAEVGHDVAVVALYTGTLSDADGPASTYIAYMLYNTQLIVEALGGDIVAE